LREGDGATRTTYLRLQLGQIWRDGANGRGDDAPPTVRREPSMIRARPAPVRRAMPLVPDGHPDAFPDKAGTRRSALAQKRSRNTRRKLIRAALEIWSEQGFDDAFEETTAEDIARAAGVSKGTFYFHFAHKEDILLEMPWATAEIMTEEAI